MVRFEITVFFVILAVKLIAAVTKFGFLSDDPCDVKPEHEGIPKSPDFTFDVLVPDSCRNGTFRWDYPRGHAMVKFNNTDKALTSICVRSSVGGEFLKIIDTSEKAVVAPFDYDRWACTTRTNKLMLVLEVTPKQVTYMGEIEYKLVRYL